MDETPQIATYYLRMFKIFSKLTVVTMPIFFVEMILTTSLQVVYITRVNTAARVPSTRSTIRKNLKEKKRTVYNALFINE